MFSPSIFRTVPTIDSADFFWFGSLGGVAPLGLPCTMPTPTTIAKTNDSKAEKRFISNTPQRPLHSIRFCAKNIARSERKRSKRIKQLHSPGDQWFPGMGLQQLLILPSHGLVRP